MKKPIKLSRRSRRLKGWPVCGSAAEISKSTRLPSLSISARLSSKSSAAAFSERKALTPLGGIGRGNQRGKGSKSSGRSVPALVTTLRVAYFSRLPSMPCGSPSNVLDSTSKVRSAIAALISTLPPSPTLALKACRTSVICGARSAMWRLRKIGATARRCIFHCSSCTDSKPSFVAGPRMRPSMGALRNL